MLTMTVCPVSSMVLAMTVGVTIITMSPNADKVATETEGTGSFDSSLDVPAVKSSHQDTVGIKWDKPPKEENVDRVCM